jgi:hypothetical protein
MAAAGHLRSGLRELFCELPTHHWHLRPRAYALEMLCRGAVLMLFSTALGEQRGGRARALAAATELTWWGWHWLASFGCKGVGRCLRIPRFGHQAGVDQPGDLRCFRAFGTRRGQQRRTDGVCNAEGGQAIALCDAAAGVKIIC